MPIIDLTPRTFLIIPAKEKIKDAISLQEDTEMASLLGGTKIEADKLTRGGRQEVLKMGSKGMWLGKAEFEGAPFKVDMSGNLIATSISAAKGNIDRDDIHWFCSFETIDGYNKTAGVTLDSSGRGIIITTTAVLSDSQQIYKNLGIYAPVWLSWDKNRKVKTKVRFASNTLQDVLLLTGDPAANATRRIGFRVVDNVLKGQVRNGVLTTEVALQTISAGDILALEFDYIAGKYVDFYVDGVKRGSIASGLPSGTTDSQYLIWAKIITNEALAKEIQIGFWDFWQSS